MTAHSHEHSHDGVTHSHEHGHNHDHSHNHEHEHTHSHDEASNVEEVFNTSPAGDGDVAKDYETRAAKRETYRNYSDDDLDDSFNAMWNIRRNNTNIILALTEETISRIVKKNIPNAAEIVLYEDHSHDAPHAHALLVSDEKGHVLIEGTGDDWHEASWTMDVDELIWDLYNLDPHGFHREGKIRYRRIAIL